MVPHLPSPGGGSLWPPARQPPSSPAHPPQLYAFGLGRGAAPGAGRGLPLVDQPGGRGGGGAASVCHSAFPGRATRRASLARLGSWGTWPPYCSGSCSRAAPGRGPCVVLARWRGFARLSRPPQEQAVGGVGARGVRGQLRPPPGRRGPFGGRGDVPSASGGVEGRRPRGPQAGGGRGGERGGWPPPWFPSLLPRGMARGPWLSPPSSPAQPSWLYTFSRVCQAAPGAECGLAGRRRVSLVGGGGGCQCAVSPGARPGGPSKWGAGRSFCRGLFPCLPRAGTKAGRFVCAPPSMLHSWVWPFRCGPRGALEGRHTAAGRQRPLRE